MYYLNLNWTVKVHILGYLGAIREGAGFGKQLVFDAGPNKNKLFIHVHETVIDFITKGFNSNRRFSQKWARTNWEFHKIKEDGAYIYKKEIKSVYGGTIMAFVRMKPETDAAGNPIYEKGHIKFKKRPYFSLLADKHLIIEFFRNVLN